MKITGLILAAGMGKRLQDLTQDKPKALMDVGGKTLLHHTFEFIKKIGATDIVVVGGCFYDLVAEEVKKIDPAIRLVRNDNYTMQNLISVETGLNAIGEGTGIFLCNVDYIKLDHTVQAMRENLKSVSAFASFSITGVEDDVMKIKVDEENRIVGISKKLTEFDCIYTGDFFCAEECVPLWREAVKNARAKNDPVLAVTEHTFIELAELGSPVYARDIGKADWFEIDTPEELEMARAGVNKLTHEEVKREG